MLSEKDQPRQAFLFQRAYPALGKRIQVRTACRQLQGFYLTGYGFFLYFLNGLIRGMTGYLLIRHPDAGAAGVTMVLAVLFIVGGFFRIGGASAIRFPRWGWTVFSGVVSVVLGLYLLATWTSASTYFIGLAIGIDLAFDGGALIGFAVAIRSLPKAQAFGADKAA